MEVDKEPPKELETHDKTETQSSVNVEQEKLKGIATDSPPIEVENVSESEEEADKALRYTIQASKKQIEDEQAQLRKKGEGSDTHNIEKPAIQSDKEIKSDETRSKTLNESDDAQSSSGPDKANSEEEVKKNDDEKVNTDEEEKSKDEEEEDDD